MQKFIRIRVEEDRIYVNTPYDYDFVRAIKTYGSWSRSETSWVCNPNTIEDIRSLIRSIWNTDDKDEYIMIKVSNFSGTGEKEPVSLYGIPVAKAWGRDSGANWTEFVSVLAGSCFSGGSINNWTTEVRSATIKLLIPKSYVEREDVKNDIENGTTVVLENGGSREDIKKQIEEYKQKIKELESKLATIGQSNT